MERSRAKGRTSDREKGGREKKVWYQSFVHPVQQAPYTKRLQAMLDAIASPGIRFEVKGLDPPLKDFDALSELRCAGQMIRNAVEAEKHGYDAFVIGHFQEPALVELRSAVDIPVVSLGESNMLAALSLGHRFGLVTVDPVFLPWHDRQVRAAGLAERCAGIEAIAMNVAGFMKAYSDKRAYARVRADFVKQVRPLVERGAEVIIPAGGLAQMLFAQERPFVIDGAPVLNGIAVVAKAAEMALALKDITGVSISRRGTYARAAKASIDAFS
ncbi:MAG TPA: aspartate/glutamate racemase family protein [Reyranella sp.]|nr:aspartate/glutamate racemase family protein [Reyranella sp.]